LVSYRSGLTKQIDRPLQKLDQLQSHVEQFRRGITIMPISVEAQIRLQKPLDLSDEVHLEITRLRIRFAKTPSLRVRWTATVGIREPRSISGFSRNIGLAKFIGEKCGLILLRELIQYWKLDNNDSLLQLIDLSIAKHEELLGKTWIAILLLGECSLFEYSWLTVGVGITAAVVLRL
jgi:hypothetical protein